MRKALLYALIALLVPTEAFAWGICMQIRWRSLGQISCKKVKVKNGYSYVLKYAPGALKIVEARGQRQNLIDALCIEGGIEVREVDGDKVYVHRCD